MRRGLTVLMAIAVGVGMALWLSWPGPKQSSSLVSDVGPISFDGARPTEVAPVPLDPAQPEPVPVSVADMVTARLSAPSEAQIGQYNALHILPWNPVVSRDCSEPGDCEVIRRDPEHIYFSASDASLEEIRYSDPVAALVLARRSIDDGSRLENYLAAVALSGKPGPLLELAYGHYDDIASDDPSQVQRRAVLEAVAARLGDERANPDAYSPGLAGDAVGLGTDASAARGVEAFLASIEELRAFAGLQPLQLDDGGW